MLKNAFNATRKFLSNPTNYKFIFDAQTVSNLVVTTKFIILELMSLLSFLVLMYELVKHYLY